MNLNTPTIFLLVFVSLLGGCKKNTKAKNAASNKDEEKLQTPQTWSHLSGAIKFRYPKQPAEALETWWFVGSQSVTTIEIEGPPLSFILESEGKILQRYATKATADKIKYKVAVAHQMVDKRLEVEARIVAESPAEIIDGTMTESVRMKGTSTFQLESSVSSAGGFSGANLGQQECTYLWSASPGGSDKSIRLKAFLVE